MTSYICVNIGCSSLFYPLEYWLLGMEILIKTGVFYLGHFTFLC